VPNVDAGSLSAAASVIDSLGDQVAHCNVVRKYLAWNLGGVRFSPRTKDNYFLVSRQKVGYAMFVGFEQYADADPPARLFMAAATPVIERLGARLKRVSNIR
jgi:hypothetical protein